MINKTIEHPLRTISFDYDETKPELPFEKELLAAYIKLHDDLYAVDRKGSKLVYDYKEIDEELQVVKKMFAPLEVSINTIVGMLKDALNKNDRNFLDDEVFLEFLDDYNEKITHFSDNFLHPMAAKMAIVDTEFDVFEVENNKLDEDLNEYDDGPSTKLCEEHENASIDLCSYDDDEQAMKEIFDKIEDYVKFKNQFIDKYNEVMDWINVGYAIAGQIQVLIHELSDDQELLDSSISDSYADGTGDASKKPIYFIEPTNETVKGFKKEYGAIAASGVHTVVINVDQEVVEKGDNTMISELLAGLQHYPKMIEKMIFAIKIEIVDYDGIILPEDQWKGFPAPMNWYHKLGSMPFALFFLEDHDARAYVLMGDLFADNRFEGDGERIEIKGELLQEVTSRLFYTCYFFMVFCHNTGFEPRAYIEAILADFDFPLTYEQVKEKFDEDVPKGIYMRMVKTIDGKPMEE